MRNRSLLANIALFLAVAIACDAQAALVQVGDATDKDYMTEHVHLREGSEDRGGLTAIEDGSLSKVVKISSMFGIVGGIGDTLDLKPGNYTIELGGPNQTRLEIGVGVSMSGVRLLSIVVTQPSPGCGVAPPNPDKIVKNWSVALQANAANSAKIVLTRPTFETDNDTTAVKRRSRSLDCAVGIWSFKETVNAKVSSVPTGGEIIIDGKVIAKTDSRIVVPVERESQPLVVVVKKSGYANCLNRVQPIDGEVAVDCKLVRIDNAKSQ